MSPGNLLLLRDDNSLALCSATSSLSFLPLIVQWLSHERTAQWGIIATAMVSHATSYFAPPKLADDLRIRLFHANLSPLTAQQPRPYSPLD
jgi:hypothetical protein